jgi:hypothetical protein
VFPSLNLEFFVLRTEAVFPAKKEGIKGFLVFNPETFNRKA